MELSITLYDRDRQVDGFECDGGDLVSELRAFFASHRIEDDPETVATQLDDNFHAHRSAVSLSDERVLGAVR